MGGTLDTLLIKIDEVKVLCIETKDGLQAIRDITNKNNGRLGMLEQKNERFLSEHATYAERLNTHLRLDEQFENEIAKDVKGISKKIWIGVGVISGLTAVVPYFLKSAGF